MDQTTSRRRFLTSAATFAAVAAASPIIARAAADEAATSAGSASSAAAAPKPKLRKAVKFAMIKTDGSIKDKFELVKSIGFQGVEFDSPADVDRAEAVKAQEQTGIKIHGVIDSIHWKQRLSDPDEHVRAQGLEGLKTAIADAKTYGATSILLVPGRVNAETGESFQDCWDRSRAEIEKVLPLVEQSGARLAIEVVWNNFITKPEQLVEYVDSFKNPVVGAYFDCSNMLRFGVPSQDWIRALGKQRLVKFDFKAFSMANYKAKKNPWVEIGEGDENWPEILKALGEIGYDGWATSEVPGGGEKELRDIAQRMDRVLGLA
jgi:hexulose-6-phosphate isomerase